MIITLLSKVIANFYIKFESVSFILTASINAIACPFGALLCSYVLDKYGRKKTLYTINIISIISWAILAASSQTNKDMMFIQLLIARIIIGICIGLSSSPSAVYSSEIAHPNLRGSVSVLTSLMIAIGVLIIYILGYFFPVCFFYLFLFLFLFNYIYKCCK